MSNLDDGAIGTIAAAFIGALAMIYKPWSEEAKLKRKQKKILDLFITGDKGTKGLIAEILPAPERMEKMEECCASLTNNYGVLERIVYEDREDIKKTKKGVENLTREFSEWRKTNSKNGGDGPGFGDSLSRIEKALGIDAPSVEKAS